VPLSIVPKREQKIALKELPDLTHFIYEKENSTRDLIRVGNRLSGELDEYGPTHYVPILPGRERPWKILLWTDLPSLRQSDLSLRWTVWADNAPPVMGEMRIEKVRIVNTEQDDD
jgi:hypothetical protein